VSPHVGGGRQCLGLGTRVVLTQGHFLEPTREVGRLGGKADLGQGDRDRRERLHLEPFLHSFGSRGGGVEHFPRGLGVGEAPGLDAVDGGCIGQDPDLADRIGDPAGHVDALLDSLAGGGTGFGLCMQVGDFNQPLAGDRRIGIRLDQATGLGQRLARARLVTRLELTAGHPDERPRLRLGCLGGPGFGQELGDRLARRRLLAAARRRDKGDEQEQREPA